MKTGWMVAIGLMPLAGCMEGMPAGGSGGAAAIPAGPTEYMVINGRMGFETCRQAGGLIISDPGNAMVACDPTVKAPIVVETEDL